MIVVFALLGVLVGWLLELAGDALLPFGGTVASPAGSMFRAPALLRVFSRRADPHESMAEPGLELFMACLFALLYALHDLSGQTFCLILVSAYFALIALMDYKYRIVLNILTYPGLLIALVVNILWLGHPVLNLLLGVVFAFGVFYLAARVRPGGIGGGDIKLAALIGAALGFPLVLWALIVAAAASAVTIIFLIVVRQHTLKDAIPYAPFLCLGAVAVFLYTSTLIV